MNRKDESPLEDKNTEATDGDMGMSYWERVMAGFSAGIMITLSVWTFVSFGNIGKIASVLLIVAGMGALYIGRYAR